MNRIMLVFLSILIDNPLFAQEDKIDTDRPDQTESATTVPKKYIQFETGFSRQVVKAPANAANINWQHPGALLKYGLTKSLELRLITTYSTEIDKSRQQVNSRKNGISSVQVGSKINFCPEKGLRPKTSLIAHYNFSQVRSAYFRNSADGANFRFTMQHSLSQTMSIGYNLGMEWENFNQSPAYIYTLAPGINIGEKFYTYIELFGFVWRYDKPDTSIDAGIAYNLSTDFKIDLSSGIGISKAAPDWYIAIGASYRLDTSK